MIRWVKSFWRVVRIRHNAVFAALVLLTVAPMEPAFSGQVNGAFAVHVSVPVICKTATEGLFSVPLRAGSNDLGIVDAYCNAQNGYRLILKHGELPGGARLLIDNRSIVLSSGVAQTLLEVGHAPAYHERRHLVLVLPEQAGPTEELQLLIEAGS